MSTEPTTWQEAAQDAADYIATLAHLAAKRSDDDVALEAMLNHIAEGIDGPWPGSAFLAAAGVSLAILKQHTDVTVDEIVEIVVGKQRDYGCGNILKFGMTGIQVRVSDKAERIKNMVAQRRLIDGVRWWTTLDRGEAEPLVDAFIDIVGYAIVADMLAYNRFTLPLAPGGFHAAYENVAWIQREKVHHQSIIDYLNVQMDKAVAEHAEQWTAEMDKLLYGDGENKPKVGIEVHTDPANYGWGGDTIEGTDQQNNSFRRTWGDAADRYVP